MPMRDDEATIDRPWWERRRFAAILVLLSAVPLLWPALPPLSDLPGHMGRWHIAMMLQAPGGASTILARYYGYHAGLIGNLGLDLIVPLLSRILPFESATKLAVTAIPMLTAAGLLWLAREAHGRVPPTALLALPLAYAWPFQFGFVNFCLAQALALCALALWLRWGREGRGVLRAGAFVPIACLLWIAHSFGWAMFGLMAGGAEIARGRMAGRGWIGSLWHAGIACLPLALPLAYMLAGGGSAGGGLMADDWFNVPVKAVWILSILRDRWMAFDLASLVALFMLARHGRVSVSPLLIWPAGLCLLAFAAMPRLLLGGAYVDMRMAPAVAMLALVAIAPPPPDSVRRAKTLALLALVFFTVRTAGTTASFVLRGVEQQRELAAIDAMPRGAAVLSLVSRPCGGAWFDLRRDQLPSMAIVRRDAFTNAQWALEGQQLLDIRYHRAAPYLTDPSQQVLPPECNNVGSDFANAIADFPRGAFTHVWTIGFPPGAAKARDLRIAWTDGRSTLYRVEAKASIAP